MPVNGLAFTRWLIVETVPAGSDAVSSGPATAPGSPLDAVTIRYPYLLGTGTYSNNNFILAPASTPTPAPTSTQTPDPLGISLSVMYSHLVYLASTVGEPAQVINGAVTGGVSPRTIRIYLRDPSGDVSPYSITNAAFTLDTASSGDLNFGTTEEGTWTAWGVVTDAAGSSATSAPVPWNVNFYPVHGAP